MTDPSPAIDPSPIVDPRTGIPDTKPRGARPSSPNSVRIIRRPLIGNMMAPLFIDLPKDISLEDAIAESMAFALRNHCRFQDWLQHGGTFYKFLPGQGIIAYAGNRQTGKVASGLFNG